MKGDQKIVKYLNQALTNELTAINQYFLFSKLCQDWGYSKLAEKARQESMEEMQHAEKLMDRILFLEGLPNVQDLNKVQIGENVQEQFKLDLAMEVEACKMLREAIKYSREQQDDGSKDLFQAILRDEEGHIDWLETQLELVKHVGEQNYLQSWI